MSYIKIKLNNFGDTIIELLIAVSVLSFALGSAYAISQKSTRVMQANKERSQAVLYANEQAAQIPIFLDDSTNLKRNALNSFATDEPRCIKNNILETGANNCTKDELYTIYIKCQPSGQDRNNATLFANQCLNGNDKFDVYVITVVWDSIVGDAQDKVDIIYGH
jgi:Tfp pilus assembly protein PilE